ncbi:MAG: hypothetical protein Kow00120_22650 [Anaerolineae bacterium]
MNQHSDFDRRLLLAITVIVAVLVIVAVWVTPYNLRFPGQGMISPYEPPPLSALQPARAAMAALLPALPLVALIVAAILSPIAFWWFYRAGKPREALRAAGLITALAMAAAGQAAGQTGEYTVAAFLYLVAALGFAGWVALSRETIAAGVTPLRAPRRLELAALALVMVLAFAARFYEFQRIPYGIEGDEAKWTAEVVGAMIDQRHVLASDWHYGGVPGSFYMQAPFHHLFKPTLLSARMAVAVYSLLATLLFYALARTLFNTPVALLATGLMSVSLVDISASRQALVEGHTKLWIIGGPALLVMALQYRRVWMFALAGAAFGLGIVTYDTYLPMLGVGGAIFVVEMLFILRAEPAERAWRPWAMRWAAFLAALGVFLGRAMLYVGGRGGDYRVEDLGWASAPLDTFLLGLGRVLRVFFEQVDRDFFHDREGPLINGLLVPFVVLGVIGCLALWRQRSARVVLIWTAVTLFPVPIALLVVYPRVLYKVLPALYLLAALGIFWALRFAWSLAGRLGRPAIWAAIAACAVAYPTLNLYIYFNEVHESANDIAYREISDFLVHYAEEGRLILIPYLPFSHDMAEDAQPWLNFYMRQNFDEGTQGRFYKIVSYEDLFATMTQAFARYESVGVIIDRNAIDPTPREAIIANLRECYVADAVWPRTYADFMLFWSGAQESAPCYSAQVTFAPEVTLPAYPATAPPVFYWSVSNGTPRQVALQCQRQRQDLLFLEAEDFDESQYYVVREDIVEGFSGRGVISDEPGDLMPLAAKRFNLPRDGVYTVWVRSYRIRDDGFPPYLTVGDYPEPFPFSVNPALFAWQWDRIGDFRLDGGEVYIAVTRPYEGAKPFAVYVDVVLLTSDPNFDPEATEARWEDVLPGDPVDLPAPGVQQGVLTVEENWTPGIYRCRVGVWDGERLRDNEGAAGVRSPWLQLVVTAPEPASPGEGDG